MKKFRPFLALLLACWLLAVPALADDEADGVASESPPASDSVGDDSSGASQDVSSSSGDSSDASQDVSSSSGDSSDTSQDAPPPSGDSSDTSQDAPPPSGDSSDTSQDAPPPSGDSSDTSQDAPLPSGDSSDTSQDAPPPSGDSSDTSQDTPPVTDGTLDVVDPTPVDPTPVDPTPVNPTPVDPVPDPFPVYPIPDTSVSPGLQTVPEMTYTLGAATTAPAAETHQVYTITTIPEFALALMESDAGNTMAEVVRDLFGTYTPRVQTVTTYVDGEQVAIEEQYVPGVAGMDWEWIAGFSVFLLMLYCLFRLLGGRMKYA